MNLNNLTSDEVVLVTKLRREADGRKAALVFRSKAIATAAEFYHWSVATDEGLTFSTFVNSFGYQDPDGQLMYQAVRRVFEAAWPNS